VAFESISFGKLLVCAIDQ